MVCVSPKNIYHIKIRILIVKPGVVVILALSKLRQEDYHGFEANLSCTVGPSLVTPPSKKRKLLIFYNI